MAYSRIKGQEISISVIVNGAVQSEISDIKSGEFSANFKTLEQGYLGEKANRYDEIYDGYSGKIDFDNSSPGLFELIALIKDRAQRQEPGTVINIKMACAFPTGERAVVVMKDAFFDALGLSFASRDAYGASSLNFKGTDFSVI